MGLALVVRVVGKSCEEEEGEKSMAQREVQGAMRDCWPQGKPFCLLPSWKEIQSSQTKCMKLQVYV